jgi:hypothetical protein
MLARIGKRTGLRPENLASRNSCLISKDIGVAISKIRSVISQPYATARMAKSESIHLL